MQARSADGCVKVAMEKNLTVTIDQPEAKRRQHELHDNHIKLKSVIKGNGNQHTHFLLSARTPLNRYS